MLLALATAVISGFSVFVNSYGVKAFGDTTVYTTAKNVVAALVLVMLAAAPQPASATTRITRPRTRAQWWALVAVGTVGGSLPFVLFFEGLAHATSGQATVIHKTLVLWVALLAVVLLRERLKWGHWAAIGLLLCGQVGLAGGLPTPGSAVWMILGATLLWSVEVAVAKRLLVSVSPGTVGVARMGLGSLALLGWLAVRGDLGALTSLTGTQLLWVLTTGVILAAYVATWFAALQRAQAVDVTAVLVLAVPITAALDAAAKGADPSAQLGWLALITAGGALATWLGWRRRVQPVRAGG
jgi:drug/metabolite transporter (DMT)-like permease